MYNIWCERYKKVWNWRDRETEYERTERVKCGTCGSKDAVTEGKIEKNEKGEVFCPPCRTEKKVP